MTNTNQITVVNQPTSTMHGIAGMPIVTKAGKNVGVRISFSQNYINMGAAEIKALLKSENPTLTGKELKDLCNSVIRGEQDIRWAKLEATQSLMRSAGLVPDGTDIRKNGATSKFVKPMETAAEKVATATSVLVEAFGFTAEELKAFVDGRAAAAKKLNDALINV